MLKNRVHRARLSFSAAPRKQQIGICLLAFGLLLIVLSGWLFGRLEPMQPPGSFPWNVFITGLLAWIGGSLILMPRGESASRAAPGFPLILIIALALSVRLYDIGQFPYGVWHDEAGAGLEAQRMLADTHYRPIFVGSMNITAPHLMLYAAALKLFGFTSFVGMRLISVGFGTGAVYLGYRVGEQLHGREFGLWMASFLAIMRWSIHFSHIAMTGIDNVFFILLTLHFLIRLIRHPQPRDALWTGLVVGGGLWFYSAYRLALVALALGLLVNWRRWRPWSQTARLAGVMGLTAVLTVSPLLIFAVNNTFNFFERLKVVSIFEPENRPSSDLAHALINNTLDYLGMFHFQGDECGLHNLPGKPMLDPVMGVLLGAGLILAVIRWRQREHWWFVLVMTGSLLSGILSRTYEAPNTGRSIGVIPAVVYFCALAAWTIMGQLRRRGVPRQVIIGLSAATLSSMTVLNLIAYDSQTHDFSSWSGFATETRMLSETLANRAGANYDLYVSHAAYADSTLHFLLPDIYDQIKLFSPGQFFPIHLPPIQPVTIILSAGETAYYDYTRWLYPQAAAHAVPFNGPGIENVPDGESAYYVIDLHPDDIASIQDWSEASFLFIPTRGTYHFGGVNASVLRLNGQPLDPQTHSADLVPGLVAVESIAPIIWKPPDHRSYEIVPDWLIFPTRLIHGLWGQFYPNENWEGVPAVQRLDLNMNLYFHELPLKRPYTARWTGFITIPRRATYNFLLWAHGLAELDIDGQPILKTPAIDQEVLAGVVLEAGSHPIEVRFRDTEPYSEIQIAWQPDFTGDFEPLPSHVLTPVITAP